MFLFLPLKYMSQPTFAVQLLWIVRRWHEISHLMIRPPFVKRRCFETTASWRLGVKRLPTIPKVPQWISSSLGS